MSDLLLLPAVGGFKLELVNGGTRMKLGKVLVVDLLGIKIQVTSMHALRRVNEALLVHA